MKKILLLIILISTCATAQWVPGKGKGYYKLGYWAQQATDNFGTESYPERFTAQYSFYFEHGLGKGWGVEGYIPYLYSNQPAIIEVFRGQAYEIAPFTSVSGIGNPIIGIQKTIFTPQHFPEGGVMPYTTLGINIEFPLGKEIVKNRLLFATGNAARSIEPLIRIGNGWRNGMYWKASLGYGFRNNGYSDELNFRGALGGSRGKWFGQVLVNSKQSMNNGTLEGGVSSALFANNVEFLMIGPEIAYNITKTLGVSLNYQHTVSGKIIYSNPSISGGIYLNLK